ncbi:paraquat-inducible protein A [Noviherbaspirillum cavernae]|uniref:Paraquat-inducible protein A n=1 Tax=Noviherbaspirillum cavernae TaxID=2320862 RepID=A0A418X096_9BURK|nr:paraquat-inducible protein A [Noviherbaspirillum cavernae]RJG05763.1 paraquat-inducible protein A [Noviherbaspirillum cavernae]
MRAVADAIACEGCDAIYRRHPLASGEIARCARCGTELDRHPGRRTGRMLPLTIACLILFAIANLFPIVRIEMRGMHSETTLIGAVAALASEGMSPIALLVLATTIFFPLLYLLILLHIFLPRRQARRPAGFNILVRAIQGVRPWGMIEVFLLGVLVAIVKLSNMTNVLPGVALWAFIALTILLTVLLSFSPRFFWKMAFAPQPGPQR